MLIQSVLPFQKCVKKWNRCNTVLGFGKGVYQHVFYGYYMSRQAKILRDSNFTGICFKY